MTAIPAICVFGFAVLFLNIGIDTLFKTPVKTAMKSSESISQIYINTLKWAMEDFLSGLGVKMAEEIKITGQIEKISIENILNEYTTGLDIDAAVFQTDGTSRLILGTSSFVLSLQFDEIPDGMLQGQEGEIRSFENKTSVFAIQKLNSSLGIYVMVKRNVTPTILEHKYKIKAAVMEYTNLAIRKSGIKLTFIMFFSSVVIFLLLLSVLIGILFANRIIKPVNKLILGAASISEGKYDIAIDSKQFHNELDILIKSFNVMLKKLSEQRKELITFHRQSAWSDIARKIAHEIKNPLTPIRLSADRLKKKYMSQVDDQGVFASCIDTIVRQVACIENLVSEFSNFARMPSPRFSECDIVKIISDIVFIQSTENKNITFHRFFKNDTFYCIIDPDQINQVLMNIIQNAINSISENNESGIGNICVSFIPQMGASIMIRVEDNGPGFSDTAFEHAFDPYYTTRKKGSGLGLSIVYKIITEHNGTVKLSKSNVFHGASVTLELPVDCQTQHIQES